MTITSIMYGNIMLQIDYSIYMMVPQGKISQQLKVTEQNDMSLDIYLT